MFETFFIGGQLWFNGAQPSSTSTFYCFPVALIQNQGNRVYFRSNSVYGNSDSEKSGLKGTSIQVPISDLPSYSSELTNVENYKEYIKFLFRNV